MALKSTNQSLYQNFKHSLKKEQGNKFFRNKTKTVFPISLAFTLI
ncbi:hypothetical protein FSS13T_09990 [Flavobacterium saliperosum S13]|uniref:Uncharacterized protein n=1 Tax=Flavobacterium saliperosum S13 TaxID=1341155 RepID=A0ABN0QI01_9FLAO|nr:hypothetical protein FSS13T_09990 [Flavobacterium saliperosum S13]